MKRPLSELVYVVALICVVTTPLRAQLQTNRINIVYEPPKNGDLKPIYDRLQQRKVLETLQRFLSPLKLPHPLTVKTAECGALYSVYKSGSPVTICYEFVHVVEKLQPPQQEMYGYIGGSGLVTREMTIVGPFVQEVLHDVALAVFDILEVPVWGRAEDAADYVAAFLIVQLGTDVARTTVLGTAYFLNQLDDAIRTNTNLLADVNYLGAIRPTVRQRYYNILCIAVGSDPVGFSMFVAENRAPTVSDLPAGRGCHLGLEYEQVREAFKSTILEPYVDPQLLKQVKSTQWLKQ